MLRGVDRDTYTIHYHRVGSSHWATVPALPGFPLVVGDSRTDAERKTRDAIEQYLAELWEEGTHLLQIIELADAGNIQAGHVLLNFVASSYRSNRTLPRSVGAWLSHRLIAAAANPSRAGQELRVAHRQGRPPAASTNVVEAFDLEELRDRAAWAAFFAIQRGAPYRENSRGRRRTAFDLVREWLATTSGQSFGEDDIRGWYDKRLKQMKRDFGGLSRTLATLRPRNGRN